MNADFFEIFEHSGIDYMSALAALHHRLQPATYIEIGTHAGGTLALANCTSIAIDPQFAIDRDVIRAKPKCLLFQMTSDDFFATHDPKEILGAACQLAFLDGMHLFEFLLRDFINVEKTCASDSLILMHDCLPPDSYVARREWQDEKHADATKYPGWWAGDVWKVVHILQNLRQDLEIYALNSPPTGLIAVTRLDPASQILERHYGDLVREYEAAALRSYVDPFLKQITILDTTDYIETVARPFLSKPNQDRTSKWRASERKHKMDRGGPFRYLNPLKLPPMALAELSTGEQRGVFVEPPGRERFFIRRRPVFHDDPDDAGLFSDLSEVQVIYPPPFIASVCNCSLVGYRTILTADGTFFNDESPSGDALSTYLSLLRQPDPLLNEGTGLVPHDADASFRLENSGRRECHLEGSTVVLSSHEPLNYGSWLFRFLPKLATLRKYGLAERNILVCAHPVLREYLTLCGIPGEEIIPQDVNINRHGRAHTIYRLDHAILPCLRNPHALLDPESSAFYDELRARYGVPQANRRLYISRLRHSLRGQSGRVMLNESDLISRIAQLGFEIIEPETLSPRQQIEIFSSAEMVVGPAGSGMFNVVFCHPGTKVIDIESERNWIHAHLCLFSSCRLRFGLFEGKVDPSDALPVHRRWSVNIDALLARIEKFALA
jgi:capsular polysaccharide biosynthesis protein